MLRISEHITLDRAAIQAANLCDRFSSEDLKLIGEWVHSNYERDLDSRSDWLRRTEAAMDLAMQVQKDKSFPWAGCSNVLFPLVTVAAMQFHSRAYPAIINGNSVVQCKVVGSDPRGLATQRADRISKHMSWQVLEEDQGWEEGMDRALLHVPIVGCCFKKSYYDHRKGHNVSEFVTARDLVVNYWARSVEDAQVKTHVIPLFRNEVHDRILSDVYRDIRDSSWYENPDRPNERTSDGSVDNRAGLSRPDAGPTPYIFLEQHCNVDLDGDGYDEPYIITVEETSKEVVRIVTRFDRIEDIQKTTKGEIVRIDALEYFTKIPFIPSPDGGFYDIGFGTLLGPLNESVNSIINQLFDAGTLSNTAGGFLGRGAKIRGGRYEFTPFSWNRVDSTGDDLRKSLVPLPVREPSAVLFQLLGLLIDYTNRVAGATDMMAGENPGQNTPAETSRTMIEQGQKIYSAIFKRIWRSLKQEFKKLYLLNAIFLPLDSVAFGDGLSIRREDYAATALSVVPVADPTIASEGARFAQAQLLREAAATNPAYDPDEVEKRYLRALGIADVDVVYKGVQSVPPAKSEKIQIQEMKNQLGAMQLQQKQQEFIMNLQETVRVNTAKIAQMDAQANLLAAEASSLPQKQQVEAFRAGIEAFREQNKVNTDILDKMMEQFNESRKQQASSDGRGIGALPSMEVPSGDEETNGETSQGALSLNGGMG